jgi:serine-type D-Ala-D-Ala carboxypeptidase/endopeptidase
MPPIVSTQRCLIGFLILLMQLGWSASFVQSEPPKPSVPGITSEKMDLLVQPYLDNHIVNAVSIGVVQGDRAWDRHYGSLSTEQPQPPTGATLYEIGSISKVFTGILLADAVETGRVKLDQPIGSLMTELQTSNKEVGESILLRHLATHSSGLPRMPDNINPANPVDPYQDYGRDLMVQFMSTVKPTAKPEQKVEYSNLAAGMLGQLLADQAGADYETLLKNRLTSPLQMHATSITLSDDQKKLFAPPHNADCMPDHPWHFQAMAGAGAIRSSTADMLRFMQMNLVPPQGTADEQAVSKAIELAWKEQLPSKDGSFAMGLGWHIARDGSARWHNGQTGGFHSMMLLDRRFNIGVVLLCNTATMEVDQLAESIIRAMIGRDEQPRKFEKSMQVPAEKVAVLAGKYQLAPGFIFTIRADGEKLFAQLTGQPELQVHAKDEKTWEYKVVPASLTFDVSDAGKCVAVTLNQGGQNIRAARIDE